LKSHESKDAKLRAKLLPYFTTNKIEKPKYDKENNKSKGRLPRKNILKLNVYQNYLGEK